MLPLPPAPAGSTLYLPFDTYDANGASVTITGLAVTDIEIYKNGSVTQRASDNGYAMLDTDGIDFDASTGLHGFSIDLSDNSDAGFYAAGSQYWIHVNAITVDAQTVKFTYYVRIVAAEAITGVPKVDASHLDGTAYATAAAALDDATLAAIAALNNLSQAQAQTAAAAALTAFGPATVGAAMTLTPAYDFAKGNVAMTEAYAANGAAPTAIQALYAIHQMLMHFAITGTSLAVKKLDGTNAFIVTLNDAADPTAASRT